MHTADVPLYGPLAEDLRCNVCIVGAGIAGLTTAWLLAKDGMHVVVVDDGPIAGGETGRTTAHLAWALDDRLTELERMHGAGGARLAAQSHYAAVAQIEAIVREEGIDCDFRRVDGYLFNPPGREEVVLEDERDAYHRAGFRQVEIVERAPLQRSHTGPALRFPEQGQFHVVKYLAALARAIERLGGRIHNRTRAEKIEGGAEQARVTLHGGRQVTCNAVVVATNTPFNDLVAIHTKQAPYRTYVIGGLVDKDSVPAALYWDTMDPYHYVRLQPYSDRHDLLIVGGEDHKTGQAEEGPQFDRLESWTRGIIPELEYVEFRWSGQVMEPVDGLAYIGRNPGDAENVYIATGDSGHGMTHGTIAGMLLRDLIGGRDNEWAKIYDPSRKPLRALGEYARENLNVATQYIDWLKGGDVDDPGRIPNGEGAVVRRGVQKVAVYRDPAGEFHEFSATCRHLGCVVEWNTIEKTWDCPCHGSRYDCMGRVVNGPANQDLLPADDDEPVEGAPVPIS